MREPSDVAQTLVSAGSRLVSTLVSRSEEARRDESRRGRHECLRHGGRRLVSTLGIKGSIQSIGMRAAAIPLAAFLLTIAPAAGQATRAVLLVEGAAGRDGVTQPSLALTVSDLAGMPHASATVHTHDGKEHTYEGVLLAHVLTKAGQPLGENLRGSLLSKYVLVTAHDGYRVLFSLPELDPAFSDGRIIVAYKVDGESLPPHEGPLRIVIPAEKREARWVRMVEKIGIMATPEPVR